MPRIKEAITDGTLDSFLSAIHMAWRIGVFDDEFFEYLSSNFIKGIRGSLRYEVYEIPKYNQSTYLKYVDMLIKPIEAATNMESFIKAIKNVNVAKNNIVKRLKVEDIIIEGYNFKSFFDGIKKMASKSSDELNRWLTTNKKKVIKLITDFLTKYIIGVLSPVKEKLKGS